MDDISVLDFGGHFIDDPDFEHPNLPIVIFLSSGDYLVTKRKKKRKQFHPPVEKPKPPVKTADAIVISIVSLLGFLTATIAVVLSGWGVYEAFANKYRWSPWLLIANLSWCLILWTAMKLTERANVILKEPLWEKSAKELKRILILTLSLHPLVLFTTAMPLLYSHGYTARFGNWVFGLVITRKISENWSVGLSYVGLSALSGIIGNTSYALVRYYAKKLYKRESRLRE